MMRNSLIHTDVCFLAWSPEAREIALSRPPELPGQVLNEDVPSNELRTRFSCRLDGL